MRWRGLLFCVALAACNAAGPALLSEEEARLTLQRFADNDETVGHVCDQEGNALMRHAARSYVAAHSARGESWPNAQRLATQTAPSITNIESYVVLMMIYGFIPPAELGQDARLMMRQLEDAPMVNWDAGAANLSAHPQCRLAYGLMRESWAAVLEVAPIQAQIERANERRDHRRVVRLLERRNRIVARIQTRQQEVDRLIRAAEKP